CLPVAGIGQKMKNRPIMPEAKTTRGSKSSDVRVEPLDCIGSRAETGAALIQSSSGEIENSQVVITVIEQEIHERGCASANVNATGVLLKPGGGDQSEGQIRATLIPADVLRAFGLVNLVPVFSLVCMAFSRHAR